MSAKLKKKKWTTPQLIVLVRGKPEEGALVVCKHGTGGSGVYSEQGFCYSRNVVCANCVSIQLS